MSSPYRTPTRRIPAEIVIDDGSQVRGDLHLHPNKLVPGGYESLLDMLNQRDAFFPVSLESARVTLVGKSRTVRVSVSGSSSGEVSDPEPGTIRVPLEIDLSTGRSLEGWVLVELPSTHPRTLDFLNSSDSFLRINDDTSIHLVNRAHIRSVHPVD